MKNRGIAILVAVLGLQLPCFPSLHAQQPGGSKLNEEFLKQERIYHGRGVMEVDGLRGRDAARARIPHTAANRSSRDTNG
jgi:hypothetical protein